MAVVAGLEALLLGLLLRQQYSEFYYTTSSTSFPFFFFFDKKFPPFSRLIMCLLIAIMRLSRITYCIKTLRRNIGGNYCAQLCF